MNWLKNRRVVIVLGAGAALAAGLVVAALIANTRQGSAEAPPASQGGLVVQTGRDDDAKLDPARPLRCFVGGRFVAELPLADCARKNGVATGALDVGLDPSGALAATHGLTADITPLPPPPGDLARGPAPGAADLDVAQAPPSAGQAPPAAPPQRGPAAACLKYADAGWSRLPYDTSLDTCVQVLYAGQCAGPGEAYYGRWGGRTLRLVSGRVEISGDNRTFRPYAAQGPGCSLLSAAPPG